MRLYAAIVALFLTPPGVPSGGFHWQRTITPPPGSPLTQACVVLDAATFANAAPALRDLRLFQDGTELPYAIEESYDPRALESGTTPDDDRSLYEPAVIADLQPRPAFGVAGDDVPRDSRTHLPVKPGDVDTWAGVYDIAELPPHVPVERVRLDPAPTTHADITVTASEKNSDRHPPPTETLNGSVDARHPTLAITLGANLQHAAALTIVVDRTNQLFRRAIFEMRRRSLCYQPRSAAPLTLYLGGGEGITAKTYNYASTFSTALDRPYATLGPLIPNPDDGLTPAIRHGLTQRKRLLLAITFAAFFLAFSARRLLRRPCST